jgi:hypothetical protein
MFFDFAITKRAVVPRSNEHSAKSPVEKKKYLLEAPLKAPQPREQWGGLMYAPIPEQIKLILTSSSRGNVFGPHLATDSMQVQLLSGYYMRLNASGFEISNVANFRPKHAKALIDMCQRDGCTTSDLCKLWTALLFWTRTLGKLEMLDPLEDVTQLFTKTKCIQSN